MNHRHVHNPRAVAHYLGPRIPELSPLGNMESIINIAVPNRIVERTPPTGGDTTTTSDTTTTDDTSSSTTTTEAASATCGPEETTGRCERGTSSANFKLPIILGVAIPVVAALVLFFFLHRRHLRKQREEDNDNRHASMDFGLGDVPQPGRTRKPPGAAPNMYGEKGGKQRQMSMDMDIDSPYILPPQLHNSQESLRSMSRNFHHENEDPYRPVTHYYQGDNGSIRSAKVGKDGSSVYTGSSQAPSRLQEFGTSTNLLSNAGGMPQSTPPTTGFTPPPRQGSLPPKTAAMSLTEKPEGPAPPPYPVEPVQAHIQDSSSSRKSVPVTTTPTQTLAPAAVAYDRDSVASNNDKGLRMSNNYLGSFINAREPSPEPLQNQPTDQAPNSTKPVNTLPSNPRPVRKESMNAPVQQVQTAGDRESNYSNGVHVTPPSPKGNRSEMMRAQRYSMDVPPEEFAQAGLGAPGFDARRLSMGFRPLPPNGVTESDDPELRANRIRSFYKEYFDESKPAPQGQYYEDYDESYLGDSAAYYDPAQNQFVMPYAEPVTRRAMTPPPRGTPRFQGQGQPRGRQGSMGAMSTGGMGGGGMRGRAPQMYPPGPYPQGPKAYSSASGRGGPRRPMPPPAALSTIPTPSKLKDDSFAIYNAMEFAPPPTFRDRVAGRSASPLGERRPYSPSVASFNPTVSAFDELAPVPSPHSLRKSGTFTALDFAPPKKFRDPDAMSDAGSIRSNRSGISTRQLGAIRNGAGRVSRLPEDMVFTKDDLATTLKPQWGMRPGV